MARTADDRAAKTAAARQRRADAKAKADKKAADRKAKRDKARDEAKAEARARKESRHPIGRAGHRSGAHFQAASDHYNDGDHPGFDSPRGVPWRDRHGNSTRRNGR